MVSHPFSNTDESLIRATSDSTVPSAIQHALQTEAGADIIVSGPHEGRLYIDEMPDELRGTGVEEYIVTRRTLHPDDTIQPQDR